MVPSATRSRSSGLNCTAQFCRRTELAGSSEDLDRPSQRRRVPIPVRREDRKVNVAEIAGEVDGTPLVFLLDQANTERAVERDALLEPRGEQHDGT